MNPQTPQQPSPQPSYTPPTQQPPAPVTPPSWGTAAQPGGGGMPASVITSPQPKRKWPLFAGIVAIAVVILAGGSAAAYYGYFLPNKPQNLLNAALVHQFTPGTVTTQTFHGTLSVKGGADNSDVTASFKGSADKKGAFDLSGTADIMNIKPTIALRSVDGKSFYIKLSNLDGVATMLAGNDESGIGAFYGAIVDAVNNQWIHIDQDMLKQSSGGIDTSKGLTLSDADMKKVADAYKQHQFLVVKQKLADQKIGAENSYHLRLSIDKPQLKAFAAAVKAANISTLKITTDQLNSFNKDVDKTDMSKYPFDVWVSKKQKLIDQVSFTTTQDKQTAATTITVDSWNQPVTVQKPAGAKSLTELLGSGTTDAQDMESIMGGQQGTGISL